MFWQDIGTVGANVIVVFQNGKCALTHSISTFRFAPHIVADNSHQSKIHPHHTHRNPEKSDTVPVLSIHLHPSTADKPILSSSRVTQEAGNLSTNLLTSNQDGARGESKAHELTHMSESSWWRGAPKQPLDKSLHPSLCSSTVGLPVQYHYQCQCQCGVVCSAVLCS